MYFITNKICLKVQSANNSFKCFHEKKNQMVFMGLKLAYHHSHKADALNPVYLRPLGYPDTVVGIDVKLHSDEVLH